MVFGGVVPRLLGLCILCGQICDAAFDVADTGAKDGNMTKLETYALRTASPRVMSIPQIVAYQTFVEKLESKQRVSAVALGGSCIVGIGCTEWKGRERLCAFPSRFYRWLSKKYYGREDGISYENRAVGGSTTAATLPMLPLTVSDDTLAGSTNRTRGVDMVFIDFSVNDASISHEILHVGNASFSQYDKILAATEAEVRYILDYHPDTAILLMDATCDAASVAAHHAAASLYGIPYLRFCGPGHHLSASGHEAVKEVMVKWWNVFEEAVTAVKLDESVVNDTHLPKPPEGPITPAELAAYFIVCAEPLTVYDAKAAYFENGLAPNVTKGDWAIELDHNRTDRASWTSREDGSVMEFSLKFGLVPRIAIIYTKGYDDTFGAVLVTMPDAPSFGSGQRMFLHGCCDPNNVTQSELRVVHAGDAPQVRRLKGNNNLRFNQEETHQDRFALRPYSAATMRVTFLKETYSKFNIKYVASC